MLFRERRSLHGPAILSDQTVAPSQKSQGRRALPPQQTNHGLLVQRISPSHFFSELGPRGVPQISSVHYSTDYILSTLEEIGESEWRRVLGRTVRRHFG